MRVLFDQGAPAPLRLLLSGHEIVTAYEQGWSKLKNGELLAAAEAEKFEVLTIRRDQIVRLLRDRSPSPWRARQAQR